MHTDDLDIVYCVKYCNDNKELKYSLRSLENIPHKRVWIYGGCPSWVDNVNYVKVSQDKGNKWLNTSFSLAEICKNDDITEDFVWFNDDFFVLHPIDKLPYYNDRTLPARITDFAKISWNTMNNGYCSRLKRATRALRLNGKEVKNFELHLPIIFNRKKLQQVIQEYPNIGAKRSLYCNHFGVESEQLKDVKIYDLDNIPEDDWDFVSTSDCSFSKGEVGKYIRKKFRKKGEYEK